MMSMYERVIEILVFVAMISLDDGSTEKLLAQHIFIPNVFFVSLFGGFMLK